MNVCNVDDSIERISSLYVIKCRLGRMNVFLAAHRIVKPRRVQLCVVLYLLQMHIIYVAIDAPACSYG